MKKIISALIIITMQTQAQNIYDFKFKSIDGKTINLSDYSGKKILIVNTASKCGYTNQYEDLEKLNKDYADKLVVIGFPANNFGAQEPGTNDEIDAFCKNNYGVTFIVSEKISVMGADMHPLFKWLTTTQNPNFTGDIEWNFEKFLIDEKGQLIHRYRSAVKPLSSEITSAIN
ncbi:MAG: glutathione peroxidase [Bacteroidia bacterium]|nr:glutathione peroxidase [Bacteroidia bacterium]HQV01665.1 glutathione peroxidase [Bacteroidia bacterium]